MKDTMGNISYDSVLENKEFLNNTRRDLQDRFSEDTEFKTDQAVLDSYYKKFREVETNTLEA